MDQIKGFLPVILAALGGLSDAEPVRMAAEARAWIKVPAEAPPPAHVEITAGSAAPAPWEADPAVRNRHIDILFPVRWWTWNETVVSFVPQHDGAAELYLLGPWAEAVDGAAPRQEVLWDDIEMTGAAIANGGFEALEGRAPASWDSPWGEYPAADEWPLAKARPRTGSGLAAAWLNRPLRQEFQVTKGTPVTITLRARAATPPDFVEPKALGTDTPAHRAAAKLKRGMNLGNGWEATPGQGWDVKFTTHDIDRIADEGFDHVRVPVAWHFRMKEADGGIEIDPAFLAEIDPVLRRAIDRKLHVMLNWHHFDDLTRDPAAHRARFIAGWRAIATHFKDWPEGLSFELLNEPHGPLGGDTLNALYQDTVSALRAIGARRTLVVSPGQWGNFRELERLRLPDDDDGIIVTIHCYDPFHFTHQGAGWVDLAALRGVIYPGPPETPLQLPAALAENGGVRGFVDAYNRQPAATNPAGPRPIREALDFAREWSQRFGRPVHLGEFGAYQAGDEASRRRYLRDVRALAEERAIPWALWEWKAGFGYWDPSADKPRFREELMK